MEAKVGQSFMLDMILGIDLSVASRSDKLVNTVSYDKVVDVASKAFASAAIVWWRLRRVLSPTRCWRDFRRSRACASRCTNRTHRSPRPSTIVGITIERTRRG